MTSKAAGSNRQRGQAVMLSLITGLLLVISPSPALAAPLSWSAPQAIDHQAPFAEPGRLTGVSCPSASLCVAVDNFGNVLTSANPNGGTGAWTTIKVRRTDPANAFTGISCASASFCAATDMDGSVWTTTNPTGGAGAWTVTHVEGSLGLRGISCSSANFCAATNGSEIAISTNPLAGAWSSVEIDGPSGFLTAVSCPSASFCLATDQDGNVLSSTNPTGAAAWSGPVDLASLTEFSDIDLTTVACPTSSLCVVGGPGFAFASTNPTGGAGAWTNLGKAIEAVSCPASNFCVGVNDSDVLTSTNPAGGGAAWTTTSHVDPATAFGMAAITCGSTSLCVAADDVGNVVTSANPTGGAGAWSVAHIDNDGSTALMAMSCPSASFCAVGDAIGKILTSTNPAGGVGTWSAAPVDLAPPHSFLSEIRGVSCLSAAFCVAVDIDGKVLTSTNPTGGAGAWQAASVTPGLNGVDCPSTTLCVATDIDGNIVTSTIPTGGAGAWQKFLVIPGTEGYSAPGGPTVSCPSVALCVAVNAHSGNLASSTNPTGGSGAWSVAHVLPAEAGPAAVSCPSTTFCVAVGGGKVLTSTNPTGGAGAWSASSLTTVGAFALSCPSTNLCAAAGFIGDEEGDNVAVTTNPAGGGTTWKATNTNPAFAGDNRTTAVACPSASLCFLGDAIGNIFVGTPSGEGEEQEGESGGGDGGGSSVSNPSLPPAVVIPQPVTPRPRKPLHCRKGFKKRKVHGKARCVRVQRHRPGAAHRLALASPAFSLQGKRQYRDTAVRSMLRRPALRARVSLTLPQAVSENAPIPFSWAGSHLGRGHKLVVQRPVGTAHTWQTILRLPSNSGSGELPGMALGSYRLRIADVIGRRVLAQQAVTINVYGTVPFTTLLRSGTRSYATPTSSFPYVAMWEAYDYNNPGVAVTNNHCLSVHVAFVPGKEGENAKLAEGVGTLTLVQESRDPVSASVAYNGIGSIDAELTPGQSWAINASYADNGHHLPPEMYLNGYAVCDSTESFFA
jgi:hypothetical protein